MQPIDPNAIALFEAQQKQILRVTGTDPNGKRIYITEEDVMAGGFEIDRYVCTESMLQIGTAVASEMTLKLNNLDGRFNDYLFEGAELYVEIGIADWTQANPTVYWIPCGYFTADIQPRRLSVVTIHALDRMTRFDVNVTTEETKLASSAGVSPTIIADDANNEILAVPALSFPCSVGTLVQRVCTRCGVPYATNSGLPNIGNSVSGLPQLDEPYTFRKVIQWCAGLMGANAYINHEGKLKLSWFNVSTSYESTIYNRYSGDIYENPIKIDDIKYKILVGDQMVVTSVQPGRCYLDITDNEMFARLDVDSAFLTFWGNLQDACVGYKYIPFSASVNPAPYLWPMDKIVYKVPKGRVGDYVSFKSYDTTLTNVHFTLNGLTQLQAVGTTAQSLESVRG